VSDRVLPATETPLTHRVIPAKGIFSFVAFVPDHVLRTESGDQSYVDAKWDEAASVTALRELYKVRLDPARRRFD
jgi:hypothetical protein